MRPHGARFLSLAAVTASAALVLAACSSSSSSSAGASSSGSTSKAPVTVGISLSQTGDFSVDGQAFTRGYNLWANYVNAHGGLDGRQVKLIILNDNSDPTTVQTNYTKLIASDHVNLVFGPFSTLLTVPSAKVAARYGYAFPEGAGGGPGGVPAGPAQRVRRSSPPVADQLVPFANWVAALPPNERPKTAAYPMVNDPFADPMVMTAQGILQKAGIKTVYSHVFPAENPDYKAGADQVAATGAQLVVLGTVDVPTVTAFITAFEQQHYNPKILAASSGPDQGAAFLKAVGPSNATGIMVPNGWYAGLTNSANQAFVTAYNAKYGGTPADINADSAEAYSVGQTIAQAAAATKSVDNAKIIAWLHGHPTSTVQGPATYNNIGENVVASKYIFQWQHGAKFVQVLPAGAPGSVAIVNPRPDWGQG